MNPELQAVVELLSMLVLEPRTGVLIAALLLAAWCDARTGRIPNALVFSGASVALAFHAFSPVHGIGVLGSLQGLGTGLALLLPFYLLRVMGAGDVKLMAMAGAFLGVPDAFWAVLATFFAGGLLSLAVAARHGSLGRMFRNLASLGLGGGLAGLRIGDASATVSLPYGVAIAAGTIGYLVLRQLGFIA